MTEMHTGLKDRVAPAEWQRRVELAALCRLVAKHGMDDLLGTHVSARLPDEPGRFLLTPFGLAFKEVTASSLVECDMDGAPPEGVNPAGHAIHGAVLSGRPDVVCVAHARTVRGLAVSALAHGLRPLHQKAARYYENIGYHDAEPGLSNLDLRQRLQRDLSDRNALMLRNQGMLVATGSVRSAWMMLYNLEKCCAAQLLAEATGAELIIPAATLMEENARMFKDMLSGGYDGHKGDGWDSALRILAREDDSFTH